MPVQNSQGRRRPLVPRFDELTVGVPAPSRPRRYATRPGDCYPAAATV